MRVSLLHFERHNVISGSERTVKIQQGLPKKMSEEIHVCGSIFEGGNGLVVGMKERRMFTCRRTGASSLGGTHGSNHECVIETGTETRKI